MGVMGHCDLFGDDDGVNMSLGHGSGFGSRFSDVSDVFLLGLMVGVEPELQW
jgi:hypothetical protein